MAAYNGVMKGMGIYGINKAPINGVAHMKQAIKMGLGGNVVAKNLTTDELDRFFRANSNHTFSKPVYRIETFYKNKFHRFMDKYDYKFVMFTLIFLLGYLVTKLIQELWMI